MTTPNKHPTEIPKTVAILTTLTSRLTTPALIGLTWTQGNMPQLTGYAPSYIQFLTISIITTWITLPPTETEPATPQEITTTSLGQIITLTILYITLTTTNLIL